MKLSDDGCWGSNGVSSWSETTDSRVGALGNSWVKSWAADSSGKKDLGGSDGDEGKNEDLEI